MIPIKGYSTFDPLKHCVVGSVHNPELIVDNNLKIVMRETAEDLDNLVATLESLDVKCYRPIPKDVNKRPPISPRDYLIVLGETLVVGKLQTGYANVLSQINKKNIDWYLEDDISSANMIRCGNHIHWDISKDVTSGTEKKIINWLADNGYRVSVTRYGWHMDGVYSILKPGVIVATTDLPELETIYKGWNICYPDKREYPDPIQYDWGSSHNKYFDVNILSVNEEQCIMANENKKLFVNKI